MDPKDQPFTVALLGYGTIGSAIHRVLTEHQDHIAHATGRTVQVEWALVRDVRRRKDLDNELSIGLLDDITELLATTPQLVCEAMGGLEPARTYVLAALERGISVVTANKQLIAHHGPELFATAERAGVQLRFEASVCAAIPVVKVLRESLAAARIDSVSGILNGTTNFILSAMDEESASYADALGRAQELGYAEPDPSDDVGGQDAAAKLAILAGIAFHTRVAIGDVETTGITHVTDADVAYAEILGQRIKLIGRAEQVDSRVRARVTPMLVPVGHPLAGVGGALNAIQLNGEPFGELFLQGPGAGGPETASALAGDIVGIMGASPSFLTSDPRIADKPLADPDSLPERFYVRMDVDDRPGVLASVAQRCADHDVSIERVLQQRSDQDDERATLVLTTHPTTQRAIRAALGADDGTFPGTVLPMLDGGS